MTKIKFNNFILTSSLLLVSQILMAQSHSNSPYSDQAYDPEANPSWLETPFLWAGLILILVPIILLIRRQIKKPRKPNFDK